MSVAPNVVLYDLWPFAVSCGLLLFVLSWLIPDPAAVTIVRILSVAALIFALIVSFPIT